MGTKMGPDAIGSKLGQAAERAGLGRSGSAGGGGGGAAGGAGASEAGVAADSASEASRGVRGAGAGASEGAGAGAAAGRFDEEAAPGDHPYDPRPRERGHGVPPHKDAGNTGPHGPGTH
jgi:hypothetical protein